MRIGSIPPPCEWSAIMRQIGSVAGLAVLYESDDNHGTGVNIAFADGHVEFQNLDRAHVTIQNSRATLNSLR
jgi:prepilin-type processing-associated H-X9-DG protein